jgi:predicted Zn-dependent peptidase
LIAQGAQAPFVSCQPFSFESMTDFPFAVNGCRYRNKVEAVADLREQIQDLKAGLKCGFKVAEQLRETQKALQTALKA